MKVSECTLYISGPVTNCPDHERLFTQAELLLKKSGYKVVNPLTLPHKEGATYGDYMRNDIIALCNCDGVALLPVNVSSEGVNTEVMVAASIQAPVFPIEKWFDLAFSGESVCDRDEPDAS